MLEQLTAYQLAEWEEYSKMEPIGPWKHDFEYAHLLATITNLFIGAYGKKGSKLTNAEDFMIKWDGTSEKEEPKQSVAEMKQVLLDMARSVNSKQQKQKSTRK